MLWSVFLLASLGFEKRLVLIAGPIGSQFAFWCRFSGISFMSHMTHSLSLAGLLRSNGASLNFESPPVFLLSVVRLPLIRVP